MSHLTSPDPFWKDTSSKPSLAVWNRWKRIFCDYLELFTITHPHIQLSRTQSIKLLRQHLDAEGQRHFDALRLYESTSLTDCFNALDGLWGPRQHVFTARLSFSHLRQGEEERVNEFISRIQKSLPDCRCNEIPTTKFEGTMAVQCLLVGIRDDKARERLLSEEENKLTWETACSLIRQGRALCNK
ncbi:unnamed protein product [Dicrocoelium dendriticum]|nr:unnamed protein product [Dicrocoelium dendriticum]